MRSKRRWNSAVFFYTATIAAIAVNSGCGVTEPDQSRPDSNSKKSMLTVKWHESIDDALAESRATGKPLLVDFTGSDWCHWCKVLKSEVFDQDEFKNWAKKNVILVELDFPQTTADAAQISKRNTPYLRRYGVQGFPTVLFLDENGAPFGRSGYMEGGPGPWIEEADKILASRPKKKSESGKTAE